MKLFPSSNIGMFGRRQRHARAHRIPVSIVWGNVENRDGGIVVVTDDFGPDEILPSGISCHCCTVRDKLQSALRRISADRARGPYFSRVAIETNEDLLPILRTFSTERALAAEFYVEDFPLAALCTCAEDLRRFELTENPPLSWEAFSRFIAALTALRGRDLLYLAGALNIDGCRGPVMVQIMQHLAHRPLELQAWPDRSRASRLELVTRGIAENELRGLFDSVRALSTSS